MHAITKRPEVVQLRYHLFDAIDLSRPDAQGVEHVEKDGKEYHAAFEISFAMVWIVKACSRNSLRLSRMVH